MLVLVMNVLANWVPIGGRTTGEVSALYPVPITPAGYAFSIWGLIYALLSVFVVISFLPAYRERGEVTGVGAWFLASCMLNVAWLWSWHHLRINASLFVMIGLLVSLVGCYLCSRSINRLGRRGFSSDRIIRFGVQIPFSVYLGWISAATVVQTTIVLEAGEWRGFGWTSDVWTSILVVAIGGLGLQIGSKFRDWAYMLTLVWAITAVGVKNGDKALILWTSMSIAVLLLIHSVHQMRIPRKKIH
jgi:translocator protein